MRHDPAADDCCPAGGDGEEEEARRQADRGGAFRWRQRIWRLHSAFKGNFETDTHSIFNKGHLYKGQPVQAYGL